MLKGQRALEKLLSCECRKVGIAMGEVSRRRRYTQYIGGVCCRPQQQAFVPCWGVDRQAVRRNEEILCDCRERDSGRPINLRIVMVDKFELPAVGMQQWCGIPLVEIWMSSCENAIVHRVVASAGFVEG